MKQLLVAISLLVLVAMGCRNEPQPTAGAPSATPSSATPAATEVPSAESLVTLDCLPCHDELMLAQQRLTAKQWAAVVKKMQGWGSIIPPENVDMVVDYLAKKYPADGKEYDVPSVSTDVVATRFAKSDDGAFANGDTSRGEVLFKQACVVCHGPDAKGATVGVALANRLILQHPAEFADVVRKGRGRMSGIPTIADADVAAMLAYLRAPQKPAMPSP